MRPLIFLTVETHEAVKGCKDMYTIQNSV